MVATASNTNEVVGKIGGEELEEIKNHFERKRALVELLKAISGDSERLSALYDRIVTDYTLCTEKMQKWFETTSGKYGWKSHPQGSWSVDFQNGNILLTTASSC